MPTLTPSFPTLQMTSTWMKWRTGTLCRFVKLHWLCCISPHFLSGHRSALIF